MLACGLLLIAANLVYSYRKNVPAGPNPFGAPTLEWATSSPPPHYNFAVIPTVRSAYPNWDTEDRETDTGKLVEGRLVLEQGHETPASTVRDGIFDEVLEMPAESPWPITVAFFLTIFFVLVLTTHFVAACIFLALAGVALGAWHWQEPQEA